MTRNVRRTARSTSTNTSDCRLRGLTKVSTTLRFVIATIPIPTTRPTHASCSIAAGGWHHRGVSDGFLGALTPGDAEAMLRWGRRRRYSRTSFVFREGDLSDHVVLLLKGRVKVV